MFCEDPVDPALEIDPAPETYTNIDPSSIACNAIGVFILESNHYTTWLLDGELYHHGEVTMVHCQEVGLEIRCLDEHEIESVQYVG